MMTDTVMDATGMMIFVDPPEHTRLRRLVSKAFTPRRIAELETSVRDALRPAPRRATGRRLVGLRAAVRRHRSRLGHRHAAWRPGARPGSCAFPDRPAVPYRARRRHGQRQGVHRRGGALRVRRRSIEEPAEVSPERLADGPRPGRGRRRRRRASALDRSGERQLRHPAGLRRDRDGGPTDRLGRPPARHAHATSGPNWPPTLP